MPKVTEFKVGMTCDGCSSACTRILSKIEGASRYSFGSSSQAHTHKRSLSLSTWPGVTDVQCDVAKQQILVTGDADEDAMLEALLKWSKASGKSVEKA